jgi:hypothetical protein
MSKLQSKASRFAFGFLSQRLGKGGRCSLSTQVRNYGDVFRQAAGAGRLTPILARYVTVSPNSCTKLGKAGRFPYERPNAKRDGLLTSADPVSAHAGTRLKSAPESDFPFGSAVRVGSSSNSPCVISTFPIESSPKNSPPFSTENPRPNTAPVKRPVF